MFDRLPSQFPSCDKSHLAALGAVWAREIEDILVRMFRICSESSPLRLPQEVRHQAVFELANLTLWLEDRIVATKTAQAPIDTLDPALEERSLDTPAGRERRENTARNCAECIWKPLQERWWQQFPAIHGGGAAPKKLAVPSAVESTGVRMQHFSPVFSNRHWATKPNSRVRRYSIGLDHRVTTKDIACKLWGCEPFIYSQSLERLFALIEGDAKKPYMKLLEVKPFSEPDRRHWIAFLAAQMFRTPWFLVQNLSWLKDTIAAKSFPYPGDVSSLRRVYETLFTNDDVFASVYKLIVGRKWELWRPSAGSQFVRSDNPVVVAGGPAGVRTVFYPMTPEVCFVAGPELTSDALQLVPDRRQLNNSQTDEVNQRMARCARQSVIGRPEADDAKLRATLEPVLGRQWVELAHAKRFLPEYWGDPK